MLRIIVMIEKMMKQKLMRVSDDRDSEVILRKMMFRTLVLIFLNFMMFMKFEMRF